MKIIPLSATASQTFTVVLGNQNCSLKVYQKRTGMFLDISVSGSPLMTAIICQDRVKMIRQSYLNFVGDLAFMDTQGNDPPSYEGLGTRWVLMYLEDSDLPSG